MHRLRLCSTIFILVGFLFIFPPSADAGWNWKSVKELNLDAPVLDVSEAEDGKLLFLLVPGKVLIYSIAEERVIYHVPLDKDYDRLIHSPERNTLILTSRSEKEVKIIRLEFAHQFDISGLPIIGPEKAPVTIAVFSDYQ